MVPKDTQAIFEKDFSLMQPTQAHEVGHHVMGMKDPSEGKTPEEQKAIAHGNENVADRFAACMVGQGRLINSLRTMAQINMISLDEDGPTHHLLTLASQILRL